MTSKTNAYTTADFTHDALMLRTTDAKARAHGGFVWPREIGSIVLPENWDPEPSCGDGLHGLLDGLGDNGLMSRDGDALWWVVGVVRAEVVKIDDEKVKVPRGKVLYCGHMPGAYQRIVKDMHKAAFDSAAATTGYGANAATTGDGANAATTGTRANAATTGYGAVAAALGAEATASAGEGGAICVVRRDGYGKLVGGRFVMIGQEGTLPGVAYRLNSANELEAVEAPRHD